MHFLKTHHELRLGFNKPPKNITRGFAFGTEPERCDVLLAPKRRQGGISGVHFYITFDREGRVVLRDQSTRKTSVSYDGWGAQHRRRNFRWILFPQTVRTSTVHLPGSFALEIIAPPVHHVCKTKYKNNVQSYLEASSSTELGLGGLYFDSMITTRPDSPTDGPIYFPIKKLGEGGFGMVRLVVDVSTGVEYASKEPREDMNESSLAEFQHELKIMQNLDHDHVIKFVGSSNDGVPKLIMDYLPLGNLEDQHEKEPITTAEIKGLLIQGACALEYLHKNNITHRDVKPANILVKGRMSSFSIKLSDFGLSKDVISLRTNCGTLGYDAPEIELRTCGRVKYDNKVDIWSFGVVLMEYTLGLPSRNHRDWHRQISSAATEALLSKPDDKFRFLLERMLQVSSFKRPSAEDCHIQAKAIDHVSEDNDYLRNNRARSATLTNRGLQTQAQRQRSSTSSDDVASVQRHSKLSGDRTPTQRSATSPEDGRPILGDNSRERTPKRQASRHSPSESRTKRQRTPADPGTIIRAPVDMTNKSAGSIISASPSSVHRLSRRQETPVVSPGDRISKSAGHAVNTTPSESPHWGTTAT
ncbi:serine/threonine protein kinase [Helicocarpus griseus UAMH5409]|uniref:Serine/threonine protein kinase n=1 Tax=Helicocarpus griseus UAMH5409 TaxID=1447875 RepID=A0A2B7WKB4_9EURO|nr:serine/threonine protein kinase [Helicocarpus griseus UAMH5409]